MKSFVLLTVVVFLTISGVLAVKTHDKYLEKAYAAAIGGGFGVAPTDFPLCSDKCLFHCCPDKNEGPCISSKSGGYGHFGDSSQNYAVYAVPIWNQY